ncbi:OmpA family protein [Chitinimonas viridis]|uniref:OmpA family protein n=1 Tax=Chitinimonas viridis TaxID=664880 RepID=A0ABT8B0K1_9NEIS|nr:OmpA family protein [Chitinimonas viridis]MDN3575240.1 OmpA family protein [Chitinimonas viridis]
MRRVRTIHIAMAMAGLLVQGVWAAELEPLTTGYLVDQRGVVVRSGFGLCWHSGTGPSPARVECGASVVAAPVVSPPPVMAPVAAIVPIPPPSILAAKVTLDADALFDFDKSDLRPAGMAALDGFLAELKDIRPEIIMTVGHTDRIGSDDYNQRLSERRVAAVKDYLVSKGIGQYRINTEGKGESEPATVPGSCEGMTRSDMISCLQPDRRVHIEVIGTRLAM